MTPEEARDLEYKFAALIDKPVIDGALGEVLLMVCTSAGTMYVRVEDGKLLYEFDIEVIH